eukprot:3253442-Pyramimonas_sp.AAC.1
MQGRSLTKPNNGSPNVWLTAAPVSHLQPVASVSTLSPTHAVRGHNDAKSDEGWWPGQHWRGDH